jgi:hypothetical protein
VTAILVLYSYLSRSPALRQDVEDSLTATFFAIPAAANILLSEDLKNRRQRKDAEGLFPAG